VLDRPALAGLFAPRYPTDLVGRMIEHQINSPMTTSCGRLFDAVAAVVGLCDRVGYEGQAAIELEARAEAEEIAYPFAITGPGDRGIVYLDPAPMWRRLVTDLRAGVDVGRLSMRFHHGLAAAIAEMVAHLADRHDDLWQGRVALSGGVFQNALLLRAAEERLRSIGCSVLSHAHVPSNDGGVALGQAVVAAAQTLERNG
jgi:hydrogenase maturation protein HypF